MISIIGPNGAGKTTLFNMLTGQLRPSAGEVRFRGQVINQLPPHRRARLGMGRTFQIAKPLIALNALENVMIGAFLHRRPLPEARDHAYEILKEIGLASRALRRASELTLSERRRLEVARALALDPQIILLDEVMAGLNASEIEQAIELFHRLHARGLTLLVIEHNLTRGARAVPARHRARSRGSHRRRRRRGYPARARSGGRLSGQEAGMDALLTVDKVSSGYGEISVLRDVSLTVAEGEIVSVIGANGAGKTTLLLTICGHLNARAGRITFGGVDVSREAPHQTVTHGLIMVPEGSRLFPFMTVKENLELGAYHAKARPHLRAKLDEVMEFFPILAERRNQLAGRLSGGERQMCAVARAMMSEPRLLMLDEPSLGLAPIMVDRVFDLILSLVKAKGLTVLLIEQNVSVALHLCQRAYILERGAIVKTGLGRDLLGDAEVQRAYMSI